MAGKGIRLADAGYEKPKPFVEVFDKTILEWSLETLPKNCNYIFCCKKEHIEKFPVKKIIEKIVPNFNIVSIDYETRGTVETILEAKKFINNSDELLISDADHYLIWNYERFNEKIRRKNIDACIMVFPEPMSTKTASYVKLNEKGYVIESAEKDPISDIASAGLHYFKKGSDFVKSAHDMIDKKIMIKNEFYVTPIYNFLVKENKKIITEPIKKMWPLGSKEEIDIFLKEYKISEFNQKS